MNCPECDEETKVTETIKTPYAIYRRRKCKYCGKIVYTTEAISIHREAETVFAARNRVRASNWRANKRRKEYEADETEN